jgi:hypothetical protein
MNFTSADGAMTTADDDTERQPMRSPSEEVTAIVDRLEAIVRRALPAAEAINGGPGDDPFRGLHVDGDAIARTLARRPIVPLYGVSDVPLPPCALPGSRLATLAAAFGLSAFDVDVVIVSLGPELDLRYERIYSYLQDDVTRRRPTVSLALDLLCTSAHDKLENRVRFAASAPLLQHRLLEWVDEPHRPSPSLLGSSFTADQQIVRWLFGENSLDSRLARCSHLLVPAVPFDSARLEASLDARLRSVIEHATRNDEALTFCFSGPDEKAREAAAHAVACTLQRPILRVDVALEPDFESLLPIVFREAELQNAVLMLERWESLPEGSSALRKLQAGLGSHAGVTVLSGERRWMAAPVGPKGVFAHHFAVPPVAMRSNCWTAGLEFATGRSDQELAQTLGSRFRLSTDQIWDAAFTARRMAQSRAGGGDDGIPSRADFFAAARAQSGHELASMATRVEPAATWRHIVLPVDAVIQLKEVCSRVALTHRVLDEWGFNRRLSHGKGITALFSGPSGTGKTMAAEVIANELGLDLFRIEIPSIVSKWIGETEKNLERVFRLAENAILFFDEADALFGKRSEVKDAHDRYANVEISYLLQRMETFEGLAILATNVRHHMDEAFLRRLTFVVQFPFPDDAQRQQIWERIWPAETPLSPDLDFARVARLFKLAGGNVKNVALAAAFAAAERGEAVEMRDIVHAVRREYQKLGKNVTEAEFVPDARLQGCQ